MDITARGLNVAFLKCNLLAPFQCLLGVEEPIELDGFRHKPGPAGLMTGSKSRTVVAVEVFVEQEVVVPVRIDWNFSVPPYTGR